MSEGLKALGHPTRLRIMACLAVMGEQSVSDLCRELDMPQALVSQQLARLRLSGQIKVRPHGGYRYYSVVVAEMIELLSCIVHCCGVPAGAAASDRTGDAASSAV
ncbi:MAG: helix-turn-helix transcriptional regulator [Deltaproteobacteria bacterium]|nr:helix-turn-helix transcriptional regulator [Deltaproteobacteria bacterium]